MALRNLVVQCLNHGELEHAREILAPHGPASVSGHYVYGSGDDAEVARLEALDLTVEEVPAEPCLAWLEPDQLSDAADHLLLATGDALGSVLGDLAPDLRQVYLLQVKGPLRDEWLATLKSREVELGAYVPDFAYRVELEPQQAVDLRLLPFVARVEPYGARQTLRRVAELKEQLTLEGHQVRRRVDRVLEAFGLPRLEPWLAAEEAGAEEGAPTRAAEIAPAEATVEAPSPPAAPPGPPPTRTYELRCHDPDRTGEVADRLRADPRVTHLLAGRRRLRFDCAEDSPVLGELAHHPLVSALQIYQPPELFNSFVRVGLGVAGPAGPALPWDGTGVLVGVADSGIDAEHPDLAGRLAQVIQRVDGVDPGDRWGHGTHVCGTVAGDGTASHGAIVGVAPGARLLVQAILDDRGAWSGLPLDLADLFEQAYAQGVRIHNNSWGATAGGLYTLDAYEVDEFVYEHPDCLLIFAAGNSGRQLPDEPDHIQLCSVTSPAGAKNGLTVGACCSPRPDGPFQNKTWREYPSGPAVPPLADEPVCGSLEVLAAFSGRGPTDDNRVKPDLVAPGTVVLSARSTASEPKFPTAEFDGRYAFLSGTSMAAPAVAGAAALVAQYYRDECAHTPSAALMKATLINGARWIAAPTAVDPAIGQPNHHQGFGRLDLAATLPVPGNAAGLGLVFVDIGRDSPGALTKASAPRSAWKRSLEVDAGLPLSITLAWTDRPAHGLQQSLDLVVVSPAGKKFLGNQGLVRPPGQKADHWNNVQRVQIEDPEPGVWSVNVLAYNTLFEPQGFSLVATGKVGADWLP